MRRSLLLVALVAAESTGCSSDPPKPVTIVKTATMAATLTVVGDGTTTLASMTILSGDTLMDRFDLGMGDSLTASKAMPVPMMKVGVGATLHYEASFDGMDPEGTKYTIALARTADMPAPNSTVVMPSPLSLQMPAAGASFSRGMDDIVVSYMPAGFADPITWSIEGPCVKATGMQPVTGDSGNFTIGRGGLRDQGAGGNCMATLTVYRTRNGMLDPAFAKGGKATAQQLAKVQISTKP